jgi:hypothetical protein
MATHEYAPKVRGCSGEVVAEELTAKDAKDAKDAKEEIY